MNRIVVGFADSPGGRAALAWALRRVGPTGVVHAVTAYGRGSGDAWEPRAALTAAIRSVLAPLHPSRRPVVTESVVLADPVTALAYAAEQADLLVIGGTEASATARALRRRLRVQPRSFGGPCPLTTIDDDPDQLQPPVASATRLSSTPVPA